MKRRTDRKVVWPRTGMFIMTRGRFAVWTAVSLALTMRALALGIFAVGDIECSKLIGG